MSNVLDLVKCWILSDIPVSSTDVKVHTPYFSLLSCLSCHRACKVSCILFLALQIAVWYSGPLSCYDSDIKISLNLMQMPDYQPAFNMTQMWLYQTLRNSTQVQSFADNMNSLTQYSAGKRSLNLCRYNSTQYTILGSYSLLSSRILSYSLLFSIIILLSFILSYSALFSRIVSYSLLFSLIVSYSKWKYRFAQFNAIQRNVNNVQTNISVCAIQRKFNYMNTQLSFVGTITHSVNDSYVTADFLIMQCYYLLI